MSLLTRGGILVIFVYILLALLAIIVFIIAILLFAPIAITGEISNSVYALKFRFLGFWFITDNDGKRKGLLHREFKEKSDGEISKKKPKDKEEDSKAESEKEGTKKKPPFSFWWKRKQLVLKVVILVLKFIAEILASFRVKSYDLQLKVGDGAPELTGSICGWLYAIKACYPNLNFNFEYDFTPDAQWIVAGQIELRNTLFRLLLWPLMKLVRRLPKLELFSTFRAYKKITKVE